MKSLSEKLIFKILVEKTINLIFFLIKWIFIQVSRFLDTNINYSFINNTYVRNQNRISFKTNPQSVEQENKGCKLR